MIRQVGKSTYEVARDVNSFLQEEFYEAKHSYYALTELCRLKNSLPDPVEEVLSQEEMKKQKHKIENAETTTRTTETQNQGHGQTRPPKRPKTNAKGSETRKRS